MGNLSAIITADTTGFRKSVEDAKRLLEQFTQTEKSARDEIKKNTQVTDENVNAYQRVIKTLSKVQSGSMSTTQAEKALTKEIKELKIQWQNLSDTAKKSDFGKQLSQSCKAAQAELEKLKLQMQSVSEQQKKLKSGFGKDLLGSLGIGKLLNPYTAAIAGATALIGTIKKSIEINKEFEVSQSTLQAVTGKSSKQLEGLTNQAKELGATTKYTATEIANLQIELAKLGFNPDEIEQMTKPIQNFATAVNTDLSSAAQLAGATLRIFNMDASETERVADVLSASCSKSALSFEFLNSAMATVAPVANAFGFSIEETVSMLGMLANAGFDASTAATATKNLLLNLANANGKLAKAIGKPVKSSKELMAALIKLRDGGIDLNTALELTDARSVAAFNSFMQAAESGEELTDALYNCSGAAQKMSDIMSDNLEGDLASLGSAWDGLMMAFGDGQGIIRNLVQALTKLISKLTETIKAIKDWSTQLYDESKAVRVICESLVTNFKVTFATIELIVKTAINNISGFFKILGKVLSGDFEGAMNEWKAILNENKENFKNYGDDIEKSVLSSYDRIINGRKEVEDELEKPIETEVTTTTTTNGGGGGSDNLKSLKSQYAKALKEGNIEAALDIVKRINDVAPDVAKKLAAELSDLKALEILQKEIEKQDYKIQVTPILNEPLADEEIDVEAQVAINTNRDNIDKWKKSIKNKELKVEVNEDAFKNIKNIDDATKSLYSTFKSFDDFDEMDFGEQFFTISDAIFNTIDSIKQFGSSITSLIDTISKMKAINTAASNAQIQQNQMEANSNMQVAATEQAKAFSGAAASGAKLPFPANIAAIAAAVAAVVAALSMIGKFANGGIVQGKTTIGDYNIARVNSGEMILNGKQQQNLFKALDGGLTSNPESGTVRFKIEGRDLVGVLSNYNKKVGKVL